MNREAATPLVALVDITMGALNPLAGQGGRRSDWHGLCVGRGLAGDDGRAAGERRVQLGPGQPEVNRGRAQDRGCHGETGDQIDQEWRSIGTRPAPNVDAMDITVQIRSQELS